MTKEERSFLFSVSNPYNGGRHRVGLGYIRFRFRDENGKICTPLEHRMVMENKVGRKLFDFEAVHHINGILSDNREENLVLMTKKQHLHHHAKGHPWKLGIWPLTKW